jgi:hypothetical protein
MKNWIIFGLLVCLSLKVVGIGVEDRHALMIDQFPVCIDITKTEGSLASGVVVFAPPGFSSTNLPNKEWNFWLWDNNKGINQSAYRCIINDIKWTDSVVRVGVHLADIITPDVLYPTSEGPYPTSEGTRFRYVVGFGSWDTYESALDKEENERLATITNRLIELKTISRLSDSKYFQNALEKKIEGLAQGYRLQLKNVDSYPVLKDVYDNLTKSSVPGISSLAKAAQERLQQLDPYSELNIEITKICEMAALLQYARLVQEKVTNLKTDYPQARLFSNLVSKADSIEFDQPAEKRMSRLINLKNIIKGIDPFSVYSAGLILKIDKSLNYNIISITNESGMTINLVIGGKKISIGKDQFVLVEDADHSQEIHCFAPGYEEGVLPLVYNESCAQVRVKPLRFKDVRVTIEAPSMAKIRFEGKETNDTITVLVQPGSKRLIIKKDDCALFESNVIVSPSEELLRIDLKGMALVPSDQFLQLQAIKKDVDLRIFSMTNADMLLKQIMPKIEGPESKKQVEILLSILEKRATLFRRSQDDLSVISKRYGFLKRLAEEDKFLITDREYNTFKETAEKLDRKDIEEKIGPKTTDFNELVKRIGILKELEKDLERRERSRQFLDVTLLEMDELLTKAAIEAGSKDGVNWGNLDSILEYGSRIEKEALEFGRYFRPSAELLRRFAEKLKEAIETPEPLETRSDRLKRIESFLSETGKKEIFGKLGLLTVLQSSVNDQSRLFIIKLSNRSKYEKIHVAIKGVEVDVSQASEYIKVPVLGREEAEIMFTQNDNLHDSLSDRLPLSEKGGIKIDFNGTFLLKELIVIRPSVEFPEKYSGSILIDGTLWTEPYKQLRPPLTVEVIYRCDDYHDIVRRYRIDEPLIPPKLEEWIQSDELKELVKLRTNWFLAEVPSLKFANPAHDQEYKLFQTLRELKDKHVRFFEQVQLKTFDESECYKLIEKLHDTFELVKNKCPVVLDDEFKNELKITVSKIEKRFEKDPEKKQVIASFKEIARIQ